MKLDEKALQAAACAVSQSVGPDHDADLDLHPERHVKDLYVGISAYLAALPAPSQSGAGEAEPVAWLYEWPRDGGSNRHTTLNCDVASGAGKDGAVVTPLFAAPPPAPDAAAIRAAAIEECAKVADRHGVACFQNTEYSGGARDCSNSIASAIRAFATDGTATPIVDTSAIRAAAIEECAAYLDRSHMTITADALRALATNGGGA